MARDRMLIFYPQSRLPDDLPNNCSYCQRKLGKKTNTNTFILLMGKDRFVCLCDNCVLNYIKYHRPIKGLGGSRFIETYEGMKLYENNSIAIVQIEFPTMREAKISLPKIRGVLKQYIQCQCCGHMVSHLVQHHWWEPPNYGDSEYYYQYICEDCNNRLTPKIWGYHPDHNKHQYPSHILPNWGLQVLYIKAKDPLFLTQQLKDTYSLPLPEPKCGWGNW